ncbi:MAG: peptide ABC transporter substrate-binding protein [Pyrinomonadaceae bacterium]
MPNEITEKDWKLFRRLHEVALERFCKRILEEVQDLAGSSTGSCHDRYLRVYQLMKTRDKAIAAAFNDLRRSTAFIALAIIVNTGFLTEAELDQFSSEARQIVDVYLDIKRA